MKVTCPQCFNREYWQLSDGRYRCKGCRHRFTDPRPHIAIDKKTLRKVVSEFVLEHSTDVILSRVRISKFKLLKILMVLRTAMVQDVPEVFDGIVEVDETYLGG